MPITLPGNKTLTLYAADGGGYTTVAPVGGGGGELTGGDAALGYIALDGDLNHGSTFRIVTDGTNSFGSKITSAPVVWDMGQDVRFSGVADATHAGASDGVAVSDLGILTGDAHLTTTRSHRHARVNRHYAALGASGADNDASLHYDSHLNASSASRKFYSSFHIRLAANPRYIDTVPYSSLAGTFDTGTAGELGEALTITVNSVEYQANIVDIDNPTSGRLTIYSPNVTLSSLSGIVSIVGSTSGATASLDFTGSYSATPAAKLWRINQESTNGVLAIAQVGIEQFWIESNLSNVDEIGMARGTYGASFADVADPGDYIFVELFVDWSNPAALTATLDFVGPKGHISKTIPGVDGSANYLDVPVKILGIGLDSSPTHPLAVDWGEAYADETGQRVAIGNAATYAACTEIELQYISSWSDTAIEGEFNLGAFDSLTGKYFYWFDSSNTPHLVAEL